MNGKLPKRQDAPKHGFIRHFTVTGVALLAEIDALHVALSDSTTNKLACFDILFVVGLYSPALLYEFSDRPIIALTETHQQTHDQACERYVGYILDHAILEATSNPVK